MDEDSPRSTAQMALPQQTESSGCRFLSLPFELRERIYQYALIVLDNPIIHPSKEQNINLAPRLLRTCRQIHREAGPVLYSKNLFSFNHPSDCSVFRHIMDQQHTSKINHIELKVRERDLRMWTIYFASNHPKRALALDHPNLSSLDIYLRHSSWGFGTDLDEAIQTWDKSKALKHLCLSLKGRQPKNADITITMTMRISEPQLEFLRRNNPSLFVIGTPDYARSQSIEIEELAKTRASLELVSTRYGG